MMIELEADQLVSNAHSGFVNSLSIEPGGEQLLLCGGADSAVTIWNLDETDSLDTAPSDAALTDAEPANEPLAKLPARQAHKFGISKVLWWPFDDGMFMTSSFDQTVKVWDTESLDEVYSFNFDHKVYSFDVNAHKQNGLVAVALDHPHIRLLDLRSTASAQVLLGHESGSVCCVQWSPTREYMMASGGSDGTVRIWDIRRAKQQVAAMDLNRTSVDQPLTPLSFRKSHRAVCNGLLWHPVGDEILSIGLDNKARIWDLSGEPGGGVNKSVNFGPLFQDRRPQTLEPCFFWPAEREEDEDGEDDVAAPDTEPDTGDSDDNLVVLLPSDTGDVLMSQFEDGKLVHRLVPLGRETRLSRQACIVSRPGEFFSGACDGSIMRWREAEQEPEQEPDE